MYTNLILWCSSVLLFLCSFSCVLAQSSALQWQRIVPNASDSGFVDIMTAADGSVLVATWQSIYRSSDNGVSWAATLTPNGKEPIALGSNGKELLAVNRSSSLFHSTDNGQTWVPTTHPFLAHSPSAISGAIDIAGLGETLFIRKLTDFITFPSYYSSDRGVTWQPITLKIPINSSVSVTINNIYSLAVVGNVVLATATTLGLGIASTIATRLFRSDDSGKTWQLSDNGIPLGHPLLKVFKTMNNVVYCAAMGIRAGATLGDSVNKIEIPTEIYRSLDSGRTWAKISGNLPAPIIVYSVAQNGNDIFVSTSSGIYQTTTTSLAWKAVSIIGNSTSFLLAMSTALNRPTLFASHPNGELYRAFLDGSTAVQQSQESSDLTIAPNPLESSCVIGYALPEAAPVRVEVVSLLGETVATLVDERQTAGRHEQHWNASGLPQGMYVVRLLADGHVIIRQLLVVK